jgi:hypothetical protein
MSAVGATMIAGEMKETNCIAPQEPHLAMEEKNCITKQSQLIQQLAQHLGKEDILVH